MPIKTKPDPYVPTCEFEAVCKAEREVIWQRREVIKDRTGRDRRASPVTGLAFSGGGIRSASFGLGVLQALQAKHEGDPNIYGIEGIDYLSTVSGGGYIGSCLVAALQKTGGKFPFTNVDDVKDYSDTGSVRHIRDFSNYLIPHGALDVVTALGIIGRGIIANWLIILPVLLFFVWITLFIHPTVESLAKPKFLLWNLTDGLAALGFQVSDPLWGLHGYWFTIILLAIDIVFLVLWAFTKSIYVFYLSQRSGNGMTERRYGAELRGPMASLSKVLFLATVTMAWLETQPFILNAMAAPFMPELAAQIPASAAGASIGKILQQWFGYLTPILAPAGALFAFLAKYLGDVVALARRDSRWQTWLKKILAIAALWFAAIIIPSFLWLIYLELTYFGLSLRDGVFPFAPDWLLSLVQDAPLQSVLQRFHFTPTAGFYLEAFAVTGAVALLINPNVTSLYRLYRDRLSKAFLFDPKQRDQHDDLRSFEPKLHKIDTGLCPYLILNAALNIEGSRYANKRGRNADFFIFTPKHTGSDATGYIETSKIENDERALDLGTAMAISGAAVSSNMGSATIKLLSFTLAFLNVRLGYWLRNPRRVRKNPSPWWQIADVRSFLLFKEMFGWITEKSRTVYLTDGGHVENLGIYSLLKRRCDVIIAVDAEADPRMSFRALAKLERYARIDLGATIEVPWQEIRNRALEVGKGFGEGEKNGSAFPRARGPHCAAGEIAYGPDTTCGLEQAKKGILVYIKASLTGDEPDYVLDYKRRYPDFPHETTGDQFFDEEQLEAYRALGFHIMQGLLTGEIPFAVAAPPEKADETRKAILSYVRAALLGTATGAKLRPAGP